MIKTFCDKCNKELNKENTYRAEMRLRGFSGIVDSIKVEYCEDCLETIIGAETFEEILRRKAERQKRREERALKESADNG